MMFKDYLKNIYFCLTNIEVTDKYGNNLDIDEGLNRIVNIFGDLKSKNGTSIIIGNGGSAAIAMHFESDLVACGIKAISFYSQPLLTASSNDFGYENSFFRPFRLWREKDNLLVAISSSGESENIVKVVRLAQETKMCIITLSGFKSKNRLRQLGDINIYVNSNSYGIVEVSHQCLLHFISDELKNRV